MPHTPDDFSGSSQSPPLANSPAAQPAEFSPAAPHISPLIQPVPPLVRLDGVRFSYGDSLIFPALSFSVDAGCHAVLLGKNGSGKSTLMRLIQGELRPLRPLCAQAAHEKDASAAGLQPPQRQPQQASGRIYYGFSGREECSVLEAKAHIRMVSPAQQRNYVRQGWKISGEEVILSGLENAVMLYGGAEISAREFERATALAEAVGASHVLGLEVPAMSQGQLRLMLILRALMARPALLLFDEPFDGLDAAARESVNRAMLLAANEGATLLVSAHRTADVPSFITAAHMIGQKGVTAVPLTEVAAALGHNPVADATPGCAALDAAASAAISAVASAAASAAISAVASAAAACPACTEYGAACAQKRAAPAAKGRSAPYSLSPYALDVPFVRDLLAGEAPLLELSHVDVFIERKQVLHDICWWVQPGESWVISGPNGSGKSTLLRLLYGEEFAAYGGSLSWCGKPRPALDDLRAGVGYVSDRLQDIYDYDLPTLDVVASGFRGHIGSYDHAPVTDDEREQALFWLKAMELEDKATAPFFILSSGLARRALLARALAGSPPVLLLDEPCSCLDAASRALFMRALEMLAADGVSILYVSHHEEDKGHFFSHELRLENGRVI